MVSWSGHCSKREHFVSDFFVVSVWFVINDIIFGGKSTLSTIYQIIVRFVTISLPACIFTANTLSWTFALYTHWHISSFHYCKIWYMERDIFISIKSLKWADQGKCQVSTPHRIGPTHAHTLTQMYRYVIINVCVRTHFHTHPHMNTRSLINGYGDCFAPEHPFRDRLPVMEYVWRIQISPACTHCIV